MHMKDFVPNVQKVTTFVDRKLLPCFFVTFQKSVLPIWSKAAPNEKGGKCLHVELLPLEIFPLTLLLLSTTYPVLANSVDPDQFASAPDLHCLPSSM